MRLRRWHDIEGTIAFAPVGNFEAVKISNLSSWNIIVCTMIEVKIERSEFLVVVVEEG